MAGSGKPPSPSAERRTILVVPGTAKLRIRSNSIATGLLRLQSLARRPEAGAAVRRGLPASSIPPSLAARGSGRILPGRAAAEAGPPGLPTSRRREERHAESHARQRAHRGPPEGGAEVPAAEVLCQGGAGPERGDLPRGAPEPGPVLGAPGQGAPVAQAVAEGSRVEAPLREVVRRREAQRLRQLPGSPRRGSAPQQGRDHLGGRARRQSRADLPGPLARGQPLRRRAPAPRRQEG